MTGNNPWGADPRLASMQEFGIENSGFNKEIKAGPALQQVCRITLAEVVPAGYTGLATLHIWVRDVTVTSEAVRAETPPNAMLIGEVSWQAGRGSGRQMLDLTRGHKFSVGGHAVVNLACNLVSSVAGEPVVPYATKRVEVTVHWGGGGADRLATYSLPSRDLEEATESEWERIPEQVRDHMALTLEPQALSGLVAEYASADDAAAIRYRTLNPNANGTPIVGGVEFVRYVSPTAMNVRSVYNLW